MPWLLRLLTVEQIKSECTQLIQNPGKKWRSSNSYRLSTWLVMLVEFLRAFFKGNVKWIFSKKTPGKSLWFCQFRCGDWAQGKPKSVVWAEPMLRSMEIYGLTESFYPRQVACTLATSPSGASQTATAPCSREFCRLSFAAPVSIMSVRVSLLLICLSTVTFSISQEPSWPSPPWLLQSAADAWEC